MRKIVARVLAPLALVAGLVVAPVSAANAADFGVNMVTACHLQYGSSANAVVLNTSDPYSWRCQVSSLRYGVDVANYCHYAYGSTSYAWIANPGDAYSWRCHI